MKHESISKPLAFSTEQITAALAAAPDHVNDPETPYDPNDALSVDAYWGKATIRLPGQRDPQKRPPKLAITIRYSTDVVEYFKATGAGWQTRMNDALREYIERHRVV